MSTAEEAAAAVEELNSSDVKGRTIKVEFSRSFRKPAPPLPTGTMVGRHKFFVTNVPWSIQRPRNRKKFLSELNQVSAGYGLGSFGTTEEADAAVIELDGEDLLGSPVRSEWWGVDEKVEGVAADSEAEASNVEEASVDDSSDHRVRGRRGQQQATWLQFDTSEHHK